MARLHFWRTDRKDKTKIKTNFPYQHTLLNIPNDGGFNCASDGMWIDIGGTDSLSTNLLLSIWIEQVEIETAETLSMGELRKVKRKKHVTNA